MLFVVVCRFPRINEFVGKLRWIGTSKHGPVDRWSFFSLAKPFLWTLSNLSSTTTATPPISKLFLSRCSIQRRWCDEFYPPHHHRLSLSSPAVLRSSLFQIWLCRFLLVWVVLRQYLSSSFLCHLWDLVLVKGIQFRLVDGSQSGFPLITSEGFSTSVGWGLYLCVCDFLVVCRRIFDVGKLLVHVVSNGFVLAFVVCSLFCVVVSLRWWWLCVAMLLLFLLFCLFIGRWSWWRFDPDLGLLLIFNLDFLDLRFGYIKFCSSVWIWFNRCCSKEFGT